MESGVGIGGHHKRPGDDPESDPTASRPESRRPDQILHSPGWKRRLAAEDPRVGSARHRRASGPTHHGGGNGRSRRGGRRGRGAAPQTAMIGLDTDVLVRYLAQDDPVQSVKATDLIERRLSKRDPGFMSIVAMAETVWVLQRSYGLDDPTVAAVIERTLQADSLIVENEQQVFAATVALREGRGSFADAL